MNSVRMTVLSACLALGLAAPAVAADNATGVGATATYTWNNWIPADAASGQSGTVSYGGNVSVGQTLTVGGNGTISGNGTVNGTLGVMGATNLASTLTVGSTVLAQAYYHSSDPDLKDDMQVIDWEPILAGLHGYRFTWNDKSASPGKVDYGVNAAEVETVMPDAVVRMPQAGDGVAYRAVHYDALVPVLIEAVKSLQARVAALEAEKAK